MKPLTIIIKTVLALFVISAFILSGERDFVGLIFVIIGGVGVLLMSFSISEITEAIMHAAGGDGEEHRLRCSAYLWETAARNFFVIGVLGTVIGYVTTLGNLEDPKTLGHSLAISFMTVLYGMVFGILSSLPALSLKKRLKAIPLTNADRLKNGGTRRGFRLESLLAYAIVLGLIAWSLSFNFSLFIEWRSILLVIGGTVAFIILAGKLTPGMSVNIAFAVTGVIGAFSGLIEVLTNLNNPKGIGPAMAYTIISCFVSLLGMIFVGLPLEDRSIITDHKFKELNISRVAWYGFPITVIVVLTMTISILVFVFSNVILK